jgi:glucose/mannose transport system substrate-binding protein
MRQTVSQAILGAALGLLASCGGGGEPGSAGAPTGKPLIEILSWWQAPGEVESLQALEDVHLATHPYARIFNSPATSAVVMEQLATRRFAEGDPPDLIQLTGREVSDFRQKYPSALESLDDLFDSLGLREVIFPEAINGLTYAGQIVAMPVNMHRENALIYNKAIFAAHHLQPPTTIAELMAVCKALKAAHITPIATAYQGWILRIMLDSIVAGQMGSAAYGDYLRGESAAGLPGLREAIQIFADLLQNYSNADAGDEGFGWTHAAQAIYSGDAAMFFHGDWAKGYLAQLGSRAGIDFGVTGAPGTSDMFIYVTDTFAIPAGAHNAVGAREYLATVASRAGQVAFNRLKGSSPIRGDVRKELLDSIGRATLDELQQARTRIPAPNRPALDVALMKFVADRDAEALRKAFIEDRPGA